MVYCGEVCKHGINTTMRRCHACGAESERLIREAAQRDKAAKKRQPQPKDAS